MLTVVDGRGVVQRFEGGEAILEALRPVGLFLEDFLADFRGGGADRLLLPVLVSSLQEGSEIVRGAFDLVAALGRLGVERVDETPPERLAKRWGSGIERRAGRDPGIDDLVDDRSDAGDLQIRECDFARIVLVPGR